tara:strand:- start:57 stop:1988 length:1932 start_codon:yes stop_codon:yes gene_type:complete
MIIKTEGPTDALALASLEDLPPGTEVFCNVFGAMEDPGKTPWIINSVEDEDVFVIHDCDEPGQKGATFIERKDGSTRPGWTPALASKAASCRNVVLPYAIEPTNGKDLRDWIEEGHTFADLLALAEKAEPIDGVEPQPIEANEDIDDPHRLARANIRRYDSNTRGSAIAYWRSEWWTWKVTRGCYRQISKDELRAKVTQAIKEEFNFCWQSEMDEYDEWRKSDEYEEENDKGPPKVKKVSTQIVGSVLQAMSGIAVKSPKIELMTWLGKDRKNKRDYLAFENGILDLSISPPELIPHNLHWFSTVCIPYEFDPKKKAPRWEAFLEKSLSMDPERIKLLQEWAGYLLLPDTSQQKFMVLKGEGSNGKSVFIAGITAMLGTDNCSHIPLEMFSDRFQKTETLGKLINIMPDVSEVEQVNEGTLKSFTSGDMMFFDRKGISGLSCIPTARMMLSCNDRPRFSDKSSGLWRRMLIVPWDIVITEEEKTLGMDKHWWWTNSNEAAGILNWAIVGLKRLQAQCRFTESRKSDKEVEDYRRSMNPTRDFLCDALIEHPDESIGTDEIFKAYREWCVENGHRSAAKKSLVAELQRIFPNVTRCRVRNWEGKRIWSYSRIAWADDQPEARDDPATGNGSNISGEDFDRLFPE